MIRGLSDFFKKLNELFDMWFILFSSKNKRVKLFCCPLSGRKAFLGISLISQKAIDICSIATIKLSAVNIS
jgi:hypothetical protein